MTRPIIARTKDVNWEARSEERGDLPCQRRNVTGAVKKSMRLGIVAGRGSGDEVVVMVMMCWVEVVGCRSVSRR
jgi:hypothetical protein